MLGLVTRYPYNKKKFTHVKDGGSETLQGRIW